MMVGSDDQPPCRAKRRGARLSTCVLELSPRPELLPTRCLGGSRFTRERQTSGFEGAVAALPISATRLRRAGTRSRAFDPPRARGRRLCPHLPLCFRSAPVGYFSRLPANSRGAMPSDDLLARGAFRTAPPPFGNGDERPLLGARREKEGATSLARVAAWAEVPERRTCAPWSVHLSMTRRTRVPLLGGEPRAPVVVDHAVHAYVALVGWMALFALRVDQGRRSFGTPRRVTLSRRPGCLGCLRRCMVKGRLLSLFDPTDLTVTPRP